MEAPVSSRHRNLWMLGAFIVGVVFCALLASVTAGMSALEFFVIVAVVMAAAWARSQATARRKRSRIVR